MGKKDKHKLGQSRNNAVFKVVNGKSNKQKGKAQEVKTKLKKVNSTSIYHLCISLRDDFFIAF